MGCVEYLLVEEDRNEKFVVKLSVCVNAVRKNKTEKGNVVHGFGRVRARSLLSVCKQPRPITHVSQHVEDAD